MCNDFLNRVIWGNPVSAYVIAAGIGVGGFFGVWIFQVLGLKRLEQWASHTETRIDDFIVAAIRKLLIPLLYYGVVYFVARSLSLQESVAKVVAFFGVLLMTVCSVRFLLQAMRFAIFRVWLPLRKDSVSLERQMKALMPVVTGLVWVLGVVFLMDNSGFKVSSIVAGLGIGGVAVALASQAVLADLFSYFAIMLDRPFELDDFIIVGDYMGAIEHMGIKTTRIRSLSGEEIVFSNKDLTDSRVRNYKRMQLRRIPFKLNVVYQTPVEKLKKAIDLIKAMIAQEPDTRLDRAHFASYGETSLVIEVVYYVLSADYNKYMDIQQTFNLAIKEMFEREQIELAVVSLVKSAVNR